MDIEANTRKTNTKKKNSENSCESIFCGNHCSLVLVYFKNLHSLLYGSTKKSALRSLLKKISSK